MLNIKDPIDELLGPKMRKRVGAREAVEYFLKPSVEVRWKNWGKDVTLEGEKAKKKLVDMLRDRASRDFDFHFGKNHSNKMFLQFTTYQWFEEI